MVDIWSNFGNFKEARKNLMYFFEVKPKDFHFSVDLFFGRHYFKSEKPM